jgi:chemotaxis regulatin CheY-phosphate phosphatase CheZ
MEMDEIMNMVPRSRLRAVENELASAEAKTKTVQESAGQEIHRLATRVAELEGVHKMWDEWFNRELSYKSERDKFKTLLERFASLGCVCDEPCENDHPDQRCYPMIAKYTLNPSAK